ncbi:hypothetical protein AAVH_09180 [Aphelenchoides avenae]|nr:hypothetical protein AAVH_09180 [Aphelenchus avenae]
MRDPAGRAVLDGLSACYGFEKSQKDGQPKRLPNAHGLRLLLHTLHHFFDIEAIAVLQTYTRHAPFRVENRYILTILEEYCLPRFVECQKKGDDDLKAIKEARTDDGYVVSKDLFRDHCKKEFTLEPWIQEHRIPFTATPDRVFQFDKDDDFFLDIGRRERHSVLFDKMRASLAEMSRHRRVSVIKLADASASSDSDGDDCQESTAVQQISRGRVAGTDVRALAGATGATDR